ncbi:MAG: dihydrodipicolinate synthase family protein [Mangrovibacterium sp.]
MKDTKYKGVIVPMISPLRSDYRVDVEAVGRIVSQFSKSGVHPFVGGTTGEVSGLSLEQKKDLVRATVEWRVPNQVVYASVSSNCLSDSLHMCELFAEMGADVAVATLPSYYPLTELQAARYMETLGEESVLPVIFYNIPATTHWSIPLSLLNELSYHPNIVGLKDSERDLVRLDSAVELWKERNDFVYLLGWAAQSAHGLLKGADGIVPSTGNFAPQLYADLYAAALSGDVDLLQVLQDKTNELGLIYQQGRTLGESLVALKVIMSELGLCETRVTSPLCEMGEQEELSYRKQLRTFCGIN